MEQDWGSSHFIEEKFKSWYASNSQNISTPGEIRNREFAFLKFQGHTMYRHIMFPSVQELQRYIRTSAPAHSYHSSAYYKDPTSDMSSKGWLGADLVFDIDADHFDVPCQKTHDKWKCRNCDQEGIGKPPEICECGKAQFETETWLCEECLQAAKHEAQKLLDILIQDFGIEPENLLTNFSGHRGYHVHARSDSVKNLGQNSRREIVDYIMATGLEARFQGFNQQRRGARSTITEGGWRGRTLRALYDYLTEASDEDIKDLNLGEKATENITSKKNKILKTLMEKHPSNIIPLIGLNSLEKILQEALELQASEIDTVVTTDIHRLIRLTNTLHGKTGWQVQSIPYGGLPDYDPLTKAVVITGETVRLKFKWAPKIRILDEVYGPYEDETAEIPLEAALFFLAKKGARVIA
jgi:DNA primase small subunit